MSRRALWSLACIGAALAIATAVVLPALAQKEKPALRIDRRFAHEAHAAAMRTAGKGTEGCAGRCHRSSTDGNWVQNGKAEHARCFESCHTFETSCSSLAAGPGKVCVTCHVNLKGACIPRGTPIMTGKPREFAAIYSHKKHIQPNASSGQQCESCHGGFGSSATQTASHTIAHKQCSRCHEKAMEPFMTQCAGCHTAGSKAAPGGPRPPNPYATTGAFDHVRHAAADRVGTSGKDCLVCHSNIATAANDDDLPMPTMQGCYQKCHDGQKAFSAVGDTCTRCHQGGRK